MAPTGGTRLGPYEIVGALGAGGMGEVYRARDTKLGRDVALKFLPDSFAHDTDRVARFTREAQVLASLNHPHIGAIYGLEEADGQQFLVLELIEGETLADRIARGPLPLVEAIGVAVQIADALEVAHAKNVIHRDIKPSNIKLSGRSTRLTTGAAAGWTVKVLDFGLAKEVIDASVRSTQALTAMSAGTQAGLLLGTPTYMSPEQARGKPVDQRTDIWSFGCVLYEMLTGQTPFVGDTVSDTIVAVLERQPAWPTLPKETPSAVTHLLERCLEKDVTRRLHHIGDVRIELEDALRDLTDSTVARKPRSRRVWIASGIGGAATVMALVATTWWLTRQQPQVPPHDPVSVLIADFQNRTEDPTFDRTLEPILKLALEGASFINAYDRGGMRTLGVSPPEALDERTAQRIAVKEGVASVVSGSLVREGSGYRLSGDVTEAVTGKTIANLTERATDKENVLKAATTFAMAVRKTLGDSTSDSAQRFAMDTLTTADLEAVHAYALGQQALADSRNEEAIRSFSKAVERDQSFAAAYTGMAIASRNIGQQQDAEKYMKEAIRYLDRITERERYRTRGLFAFITGDYQACIKEYSDMIAKYAADAAGHNNLALCLSNLRMMPAALQEMQQAVRILPKRALYRLNLALYAAYGGNFQSAETDARTAQELGNPLGWLAVAFAQLGQGKISQATDSYDRLAANDALSASYAASGLGDMAIYEGRFSEAVRILTEGAAVDMSARHSDRAAAKFVAVSHAQLLRHQNAPAVAAAEKALAISESVKTRFLAARVFVEVGDIARGRDLVRGFAAELQAEPQALAKIIDGDAALRRGDARAAVKALTEANTLFDTWVGHFDLGRAYLEAGAATQADSEFDRCIRRRGEALALFLDEEPTYSYFPAVYYYQGRVRDQLNSAGAGQSYRTYLGIREKAGEDPLLTEIRGRATP